MAQEQQGLLDRLDRPERVLRAGREFWRGSFQGQALVIGLSRIGKVAAATTATALIEAFDVQAIVFTGVAGGLQQGVSVGDVVVASSFVQHDMDASPLFPRFEIPLYARTLLPCDAVLTALLLQSAHAAAPIAADLCKTMCLPTPQRVHTGLIASGDRFVSAATEAQALQQRLQACGMDALAVEMEGAAVAQVCCDYGLPFAAIRTISDRADDQAHVDFPRFIQEVASPYAMAILDQFLSRYAAP